MDKFLIETIIGYIEKKIDFDIIKNKKWKIDSKYGENGAIIEVEDKKYYTETQQRSTRYSSFIEYWDFGIIIPPENNKESIFDGYILRKNKLRFLPAKRENTNVVVTGEVPNYTRNRFKKYLKDEGINLQSGVTKKTDFLIVGDSPGIEKRTDASLYGIPEICWKEFLDWFNVVD